MRVLEERVARPSDSSPCAAKRFADALLDRTTICAESPASGGGCSQPSTPEQTRLIEHYRWLMAVMPSRSAEYQQTLAVRLAEEAAQYSDSSTFAALVLEADWDSSKHPRRGGPPNAGWFADKGTGTTRSASTRSSLLDKIVDRNHQLDELTGGPTKATKRARELADAPRKVRSKIKATLELAHDVAKGFEAGLRTGEKALINGGANAIKNVATLGLSTSQLELIAVTDEDRANGYDTAVAIATASGEVLIAVGTGGVGAALSKGGTVARAAGGALVVYDMAGNAVGVVQGIYDAATDGVSISNAASVTASALGLSANIRSIGNLAKAQPGSKTKLSREATPEEVKTFVDNSPRKNTPNRTAANQYEIKHTGPYNHTVSGGGEELDIDGYFGTTILEAKYVEKPSISPYVTGSSIPAQIRETILAKPRDEIRRAKIIIESGDTPFRRIEIITNTPESKATFEKLLNEYGVPGTVRLEK